jgi:uncharacterized protein YwgA
MASQPREHIINLPHDPLPPLNRRCKGCHSGQDAGLPTCHSSHSCIPCSLICSSYKAMLRRQRTILRLLGTADDAVSATQLQKYLFLLREETFLGRDATFYEFLPYKFGPYSFAAQREIEALTTYGYIASFGSSLAITTLGKNEATNVDGDTTRAVLAIVSKYGKKPLRSLLRDVYARYPWYAFNSELKDLIPAGIREAKAAPAAVYTIGYEQRSVDGFLNKVIRAGIRRIIDVRANPVSRKYGFARSALASLAGKLGLGYTHCPELGISSEKRREVRTPSEFKELFAYYERQILPVRTDDVAKVADLMKAMPSVLVCMEKEAVDCHRSRLAMCVASVTNLHVVHL